MSWEDHIVIDPDVMGGKPVIKGTRVPVQVIVGALAGGDTVEDGAQAVSCHLLQAAAHDAQSVQEDTQPAQHVCAGYKVTEEDVRAALTYAAGVLGEERLHALPGG